jgi:fluoroquinolone transport system permease protein
MTLSLNDFKLIFRDKTLRIFLAMPLLIFALILFFVPNLMNQYEDVIPYIPLILMAATMQTSTMFGFIYAIVLIHEKDMQVAKVYGVLPVSKTGFIVTRMFLPFLLSSVLTFLLLLVQPFHIISICLNVLLSMLCGLFAPLMAIFVSILSKNKMEGLTWFKIVNLFVILPLAAFFIPRYNEVFGILPTHWAFQALDAIVSGGNVLILLLVGFMYVSILLVFSIWTFTRVHFQ